MPFKLTMFRYDRVIANFTKAFLESTRWALTGA